MVNDSSYQARSHTKLNIQFLVRPGNERNQKTNLSLWGQVTLNVSHNQKLVSLDHLELCTLPNLERFQVHLCEIESQVGSNLLTVSTLKLLSLLIHWIIEFLIQNKKFPSPIGTCICFWTCHLEGLESSLPPFLFSLLLPPILSDMLFQYFLFVCFPLHWVT